VIRVGELTRVGRTYKGEVHPHQRTKLTGSFTLVISHIFCYSKGVCLKTRAKPWKICPSLIPYLEKGEKGKTVSDVIIGVNYGVEFEK
jgi:hypothetical protein